MWEGGVRVCGLVEWPSVIKSPRVSDYPIVTTDFVPTALAAVGVEPSAKKPLDGANLIPFFSGEESQRVKPIGFHANGWDAWMTHQYKIVKGGKPGQGTEGEWELYDLREDPFEERNMARQRPDLFQQLHKAWETWAADAAKDCEAVAKAYPQIKGLRHITKGHGKK